MISELTKHLLKTIEALRPEQERLQVELFNWIYAERKDVLDHYNHRFASVDTSEARPFRP